MMSVSAYHASFYHIILRFRCHVAVPVGNVSKTKATKNNISDLQKRQSTLQFIPMGQRRAKLLLLLTKATTMV